MTTEEAPLACMPNIGKVSDTRHCSVPSGMQSFHDIMNVVRTPEETACSLDHRQLASVIQV